MLLLESLCLSFAYELACGKREPHVNVFLLVAYCCIQQQGEYKNFPGMFPHAAGMIASHGPYDQVSDIYKIDGITANDKKMFKKYDKYFTVNPPDPRSVDERINARVST